MSDTVTTATGSTGKALQDGGARATIALLLAFALRFAEARVDLMTDSELADAMTLLPSVVILLGAGFDHFVKPRL